MHAIYTGYGQGRAEEWQANFAGDGAVLYRSHRSVKAAGDSETIAIRLADCDGQRNSASMVVNRQYGARGYGSNHRINANEASTTFVASSDVQIFGTITLVADSKNKLAADRTFGREVDELRRRPGAVLCELTKFAFDPSPDSRPFLASLFHVVYIYGTEHFGGTDLLIEVNPRHVRFYELMLGFRKIGGLCENEAVGAPSQLMHVAVADICLNIRKWAGKTNRSERTLYSHFFSEREEKGLRGRIAEYAADRRKSRQSPSHICKAEMRAAA
ncbi:N-acyl amino acid synthase FeeM domain-containing protein [Tsuneonella amylolytica]|uniref:N-acyl amino acid synthase FeeM domain-containing protein n=1 Tax=Tsuneonella amylolytica TaxID=2338327 RepID=UPI0013C4F390|nr:acetyltransferase [Tsuneonella amylolytica]